MSSKRINPRLVKKNRPYQVGELASALDVHKNTIRNWREKGLCPIDDGRPMMFRGVDVIDFLVELRDKAKTPCRPGTMYCLRCKEPRAPALGLADCYRTNATTGNLQALCEHCEAIMNRRVALSEIPSTMPNIEVQFPQVPSRLKGCRNAPPNCDSKGKG